MHDNIIFPELWIQFNEQRGEGGREKAKENQSIQIELYIIRATNYSYTATHFHLIYTHFIDSGAADWVGITEFAISWSSNEVITIPALIFSSVITVLHHVHRLPNGAVNGRFEYRWNGILYVYLLVISLKLVCSSPPPPSHPILHSEHKHRLLKQLLGIISFIEWLLTNSNLLEFDLLAYVFFLPELLLSAPLLATRFLHNLNHS